MRTTAISNNLILTTRIKIFANQFKCPSREKFSVLVLKGAISGPHLTVLCNNNVLGPQLTFVLQ